MKKVKALLYCTKSTPYLIKDDFPLENEPIYYIHHKEDPRCFGLPLNGKIIGQCEVETEEIKLSEYPYYDDCSIALLDTDTLNHDELLCKSCLSDNELDDYLIDQKGYALHIENLSKFARPQDLIDYWGWKSNKLVRKAPQNIIQMVQLQQIIK